MVIDKKPETVYVLLSGGQDSCTCLAWAQERFAKVRAVCIEYGQRHSGELRYALRFCQQRGVTAVVVNAHSLGYLMRSALTHPGIPVAKTGGIGGLPSTFTPGRNLLFLTIASSMAIVEDIRDLVIGVCETDYSGYPDCRLEFVESFERTFRLAIGQPVGGMRIHTPLMRLNKAQTFALADELGILEEIRLHTMSCYHGTETMNPWGRGCAECPACELRRNGYEAWLKMNHAAAPA